MNTLTSCNLIQRLAVEATAWVTLLPTADEKAREAFVAWVGQSANHLEQFLLAQASRATEDDGGEHSMPTPQVFRASCAGGNSEVESASVVRIERLTRSLAMMSRMNAAVTRIRDRTSLFEEVCLIAHEVGKYAGAFITLIDPANRVARTVAWRGAGLERIDAVRFIIDGPEANETITEQALRTGQPVIRGDLHHDRTRVACGLQLSSSDLHCAASIPLLVDGTPVGAFTVCSADVETLEEESFVLLQEVVSNLSSWLQYLCEESHLRSLPYFDSLSGFARPKLFCERVARVLACQDMHSLELVVAAFDISHLENVNEALGRHWGDVLIQLVAEALRKHFGDAECLAHVEEGMFAVMLAGQPTYEEAIRILHDRLTAVFGKPFQVGELEVSVEFQAGLARFPENGLDSESLLQNAVKALHKARATGERYLRCRREVGSARVGRAALGQRLRGALGAGQFLLHYQPKLSIGSGEIVGVEALLRWQDPDRGLVGPEGFHSVLESTGLIVDVGEWVLQRASEDLVYWRRNGLKPTRVAVNVSAIQLREAHFADRVLAASVYCGSGGLDLEISEDALLEDLSAQMKALRLLREKGVTVAIDHFGTGYSSLSRLSALPVDALKIDRSFVGAMVRGGTSQALVSAMISLARALELKTIAVGVETRGQLELLRSLGCDEAQGYLYCRPLPRERVELLLSCAGGGGLPSESTRAHAH